MERPALQYFDTAQVVGIPAKNITVRLANGRVLGRFRGLIIDPLNDHLRYWSYAHGACSVKRLWCRLIVRGSI